MEDKKRKKEDKKKRESSQKAAEQKKKVLDSVKPASAQSSPSTSSGSPSPGPALSSSPSPASVAAGPSSQGGNNAKRLAVANGQLPSSSQGPQRYMPREVPPRFRCQQDHKVLLKRGQPPLSCMLLGGGNPSLSQGDNSNASEVPDLLGLAASSLSHSSSSVSDPSTTNTTISNYANSMWGVSSGSQPLSQGWEKVVVDGSDLKEWPRIVGGDATADSEHHLQQEQNASLSNLSKECIPSGGAWGSSSPQPTSAGPFSCAPKTSLLPKSPDTFLVVDGGNSSANFTPNANPSAWPALVQDGATSDTEDCPASLPSGPALSSNPSSGNPLSHQQEAHQMGARDREPLSGEWEGRSTGPKKPDFVGTGGEDHSTSSSSSSSSASSSFRAHAFSSNLRTAASGTDTWDGGQDEDGPAEGRSQGAWVGLGKGELSVEEWGISSSLGAGDSVEGSVGSSSMLRAWDNQKSSGDAGMGETGKWSSQDRGGTSSSSGGENSRGGSSSHSQHNDRSQHHYQPPNTDVALQDLLSRSDLDPRVLSNSGWGQTQIRQNVAWDLESSTGSGVKDTSQALSYSASFTLATADSIPAPHLTCAPVVSGLSSNVTMVTSSIPFGDGLQSPSVTQSVTSAGSCSDPVPQWRENKTGGGASGWTDLAHQGSGWGGGKDDKGLGGWKEMGREGCSWEPQSRSTGWGESKVSGGNSVGAKWSSWDDRGTRKGDKDGNSLPGWGKTTSPVLKTQGPCWTSGPIPHASEGLDPSGWEEPSPQSISRKMEIDDGTSAWGDPSNCNNRSVNLWDKNAPTHGPSKPVQTQQQEPPGRPHIQTSALAGRDLSSGHVQTKNSAPAGWGGGVAPCSPSVDNGTSAWGKPGDAPTGWGDMEDAMKPSGSKPMQEGWGEGDCSVSASRHSSWEEEEEESGGVWSSTGSQGSSSSYNSSGWAQVQGAKRANVKGSLKGTTGDSWMNPISRQFSHMGLFQGEEPSSRPLDLTPGPHQDKKLEGDKRGMGLSDYNGEMFKSGRGGGRGTTIFRSSTSKEVGASDPGLCGDRLGGHNVFGGGGSLTQARGVHASSAASLNTSPGMRAQVPHQYLSPQVPGSMLKQMPPGSSSVGGVGGVFPAQLSPQNIAMLSNIYPPPIQFQLACQLLLQQQQSPQQQQLLQNQRKFPQNIRQQPDPQQLARIMAVLQRQQQQQHVGSMVGGSRLSPSHPKQPIVDTMSHPGLSGGFLSEQLHPKTPGMNLSGLDIGGIGPGPAGLKDAGVQQSRFKRMMEGSSLTPSPPDSAFQKNSTISAPGKLRDSSHYSQYNVIGSGNLGVPSPGPVDNWHRIPANKIGTKSNSSSWPPEFQPGVPWKGIQSSNPETDPYMTPGGTSSLSDTEHQLLRDNSDSNPPLNTLLPSHGAWPYSASESPVNSAHNPPVKYSDYKPSWPPEPIGHNKVWKANRNAPHPPRPPPGLSHQKAPSLMTRAWGGHGSGQETRYGQGSTWSDGTASKSSCWLVLSNLTPQIDGSTLRTICMQHGPLLTFHLGLTQGSALIRYSSRLEAAKARSALHMCVLGNTTILAEFVSEEEVSRYFELSQAGGTGSNGGGVAAGSHGPTGSESEQEQLTVGDGAGGNGNAGGPSASNWQNLEGTRISPDTPAQGSGLNIFTQWSSNSTEAGSGGAEPPRQGLWGGVTPNYSSSSLWGAPRLEDRHQMSSPAALLPGDLLGGGIDSI